MVSFKRVNTYIAWAVFGISLLVYALTLETTVSFWDCGEFISAAYKLQVTHPPGAPLYQLLGRLFSLFALENPTMVAFWVNMLSAVSGAFCVLLTYLITVLLAKKISLPINFSGSKHQYFSIWAAGIIAAFTLAFSDTFWFSAVEAEVYSLSSLFTMLVFWAALRWDESKNNPYSVRWLLFIALAIGLSIGVHLLNLLVIPAIVCIVYLGATRYSFLNLLKGSGIGVAILLFIQFIIIPGIPFLSALTDKWLVNSFSWNVGSGALLLIFSVITLLTTCIIIFRSASLKGLYYGSLCTAFLLIGYSSYMVVPIRAAAQPSININKPDNPASFVSYINREQYGSRSLVYGPAFNASVTKFKKGKTIWRPDSTGKYGVSNYTTEYEFGSDYMMWFPRMGDVFNESSKDGYVGWTQVDDSKPPTQLKNWEFFFKYQFLHMYVRYHLWNFAGRQNNEQGHGNALDGNSASGFSAVDNLIAAPDRLLPDNLKSKAKNHYYFLPLLLGFLGLFYHARKSRKSFMPLLVLFLFTGVFLCFYLNVPPFEPRERDYVFVGSFQVFSIWIGFGALAVMRFLQSKWRKGTLIGFLIIIVIVPMQLIGQNWDDHDRSNRSFARDYAYNMLSPLAPNAILLVHGDNDTYPLWYLQNVEGIRTDVRVINANLLGSDWGAFALTQQQGEAMPLQLSISPYAYQQDMLAAAKVRAGEAMPLQDVLNYVADSNHTIELSSGKLRSTLPTNRFITLDDTIEIKQHYTSRADIILLDIISNNNNPVYFAARSIDRILPALAPHFKNEGLVYRLAKTKYSTEKLKEHTDPQQLAQLIQQWQLSGYNNADIYIDADARKVGRHYHSIIAFSIKQLLNKGMNTEAEKLALLSVENFPVLTSCFSDYKEPLLILEALYKTQQHKAAKEYQNQLSLRLRQDVLYYHSIRNTIAAYSAKQEFPKALRALKQLQAMFVSYNQNQKAEEIEKFLAFFVSSRKKK